jgi:hypothetical protein
VCVHDAALPGIVSYYQAGRGGDCIFLLELMCVVCVIVLSPAAAAVEAATSEPIRVLTPDPYYQGYHDIAGVLLLVCGEELATAALVGRCRLESS